jgi:hypothetical protein
MKEDKIKEIVSIFGLILSVPWLIWGGGFEAAISTITSGAAVLSLFWIKPINEIRKRIKRITEWLLIGIIVVSIFYGALSLALCHEHGIKIKNLKNGYRVDNIVDLEGTICKIETNQIVWVVVYSYSDEKFYPHPVPAKVDYKNGDWENLKTVVGVDYEKSGNFDIYSIIIDNNSPSHNSIRKYFALLERQGLTELPPSNATDVVNVIRK